MARTEDTEITLGTGKLLVLFFALVTVCALFFALGYSLGRRSDATVLLTSPAVQAASDARHSNAKPAQSAGAQPPMTFYKAVEQKDASPQLTPASAEAASSLSANTTGDPSTVKTDSSQTSSPADPMGAPAPTNGYYVQVAAVSKDEDAEALVDALKKKQYPSFVAASSAADKLFHVQVGPFGDLKEAEAMRTRLVSDGYNPILKK